MTNEDKQKLSDLNIRINLLKDQFECISADLDKDTTIKTIDLSINILKQISELEIKLEAEEKRTNGYWGESKIKHTYSATKKINNYKSRYNN